MKKLLFIFLWMPLLAFGQTQTRNDAGLQGNQGAVAGFFETSAPINYPAGASSWWHLLDVRHSNTENNFAMQFAGSFFDQGLYFRKTNNYASQPWLKVVMETDGKVGIGVTSPTERLVVNGNMRVMLDEYFPQKNVVGIVRLGFSGVTGAQNWTMRSVYQYPMGVGLNADGGDLDILKSIDGNIILGTKTDGTALGNIGIGTASPKEKLSVNGKVRAHEIEVEVTGWPDYVFKPEYQSHSLAEVEKFIKKNGHLPDVPSAITVETKGLELGEMNKLLLKKIEELTLHLIEKDKKIDRLVERVEALEAKK